MTVLIDATGSTLLPGFYLMVFAVVGLVAALSLKETAGSSLLRPGDVPDRATGEASDRIPEDVPDRTPSH